LTNNGAENRNTYLWCDQCRRSFRHEESQDGACPICGVAMRPTGKVSAILRGLMANELAGSPIVTRHRQIIRLIWTRNGQGEQYYRLLDPGIPYNRFEARVTEVICRGAEEGWISIVLPPAPCADEQLYRIDVQDENRFIAELEEIASQTKKH
jgi:hypothetical protein